MKSIYLIITIIAVFDLLFFAAFPAILFDALESGITQATLGVLVSITAIRFFVISILYLFVRSILDDQYCLLSQELSSLAIDRKGEKMRLTLNAEITNYLYGYIYPKAQVIAEALILLSLNRNVRQ